MKFIIVLLVGLLSFSLMAKDIKVMKLKGKVSYDGEEIKEGDLLDSGAYLEVGKKSFAFIKFDNGNQVLLKDGKLKLENKVRKEKGDKTILSLVRGMIFSYKPKKSKHRLFIKTKTAAMGVRGTKFFVQEDEKETYLCVCTGQVSVNNGLEKILVNKNEDVHIKKKQSLKKTKANKMMMNMAWDGFKTMGLK